CHQEEHAKWISSPHANSSLNDRFRTEYAKLNQPSYCMSCHASGYDIETNEYVFEGVVCSTCHYTEGGAEHPPAPFKIANQSAACGSCHSGAHAPSYDEWLVSAHNAAKIDCVDCHTPHDNGFVTGDINTTCGNCHKDALKDEVHMGKDATTGKDFVCVDCHMTQERDTSGVFAVKTGHSMEVEPSTCSTCHGDIHELQASTTTSGSPPAQAGSAEISDLEAQVKSLQDTAQVNWATGIAGGAVGVLIIIGVSALILRRGSRGRKK
ncbi:MAG: multiheme c-type cytochrome, partial [Anaerolineae bacterium]